MFCSRIDTGFVSSKPTHEARLNPTANKRKIISIVMRIPENSEKARCSSLIGQNQSISGLSLKVNLRTMDAMAWARLTACCGGQA